MKNRKSYTRGNEGCQHLTKAEGRLDNKENIWPSVSAPRCAFHNMPCGETCHQWSLYSCRNQQL